MFVCYECERELVGEPFGIWLVLGLGLPICQPCWAAGESDVA